MHLNFNEPIRQLINSTTQEYIASCQLISDALGIPTLILDINHQVIFASKMLNLQFSLKEEVVGKNLSTFIQQIFPAHAVGIEELVATHQQIISTNQRRIYLEIHKKDNTIEAYISHKTPVFDQNNNFLCLHIQYKPFTIARLANLGAKFHQVEGYYPLKRDEFANIELTRVQQQIIYLYVRNYSYTEIADWMNRLGHRISPAAVNKQLMKLKNIFNVNGSDELKNISFKYGYDVAIPAEFISEGIHDITEDVFDLWVC